MLSRNRQFVAPAYLLACLVLGGSTQGIWQNMLLQLTGLAIIAWAAMERRAEPIARAAKQFFLLTIAFLCAVVLQMIPVPPNLWEHLGPRGRIAAGFRALHLTVPAEPLSLTPAAGVSAILMIIPPLALFCAIVRLKAYRTQTLAVALITGTMAAIALGTLQVTSSTPELSPWYLYEETNPGRAVGFFANADHMADLLVITIPFIAATVAATRRASVQRYSAIAAVAGAIAITVGVGLALNGSLAGYGLSLPVVAASALLIVPARSRVRKWIVAVAVVLVIGSIIALEITPIGSGKIGAHAASAVQSRSEILSTTLRATGDFMPFGSGLGSFQSVYPLYEKPSEVTTIYVVHAHNDYAEVALELGVAGILLLLLFLAWWGVAASRAWRTPAAGPFARAAGIASAAILVHSLVDFPLRTAAIAACFGCCLAILCDSRSAPASDRDDLRPGRHVEVK